MIAIACADLVSGDDTEEVHMAGKFEVYEDRSGKFRFRGRSGSCREIDKIFWETEQAA